MDLKTNLVVSRIKETSVEDANKEGGNPSVDEDSQYRGNMREYLEDIIIAETNRIRS